MYRNCSPTGVQLTLTCTHMSTCLVLWPQCVLTLCEHFQQASWDLYHIDRGKNAVVWCNTPAHQGPPTFVFVILWLAQPQQYISHNQFMRCAFSVQVQLNVSAWSPALSLCPSPLTLTRSCCWHTRERRNKAKWTLYLYHCVKLVGGLTKSTNNHGFSYCTFASAFNGNFLDDC